MVFNANGCNRAAYSFVNVFVSTLVLVLGLSQRCYGQDQPSSSVGLRDMISGACDEVHRYVESVVGTTVIKSTVEFVDMLIRFLAEGAASGLNVIAVYVTEILRVTGIDVNLPVPPFTPEGVASVAQWGLLALIGYWVLSVVLRVLVGVVRRVFWLLKTVAALWVFGLIVSDGSAGPDVTAVRLTGLVLGYTLLGLAGSGSEKAVTVEDRLSSLEGRLNTVEKREE
ncbi:voltage-gated monoatomic cation channel TMEM109 isoform X2 [Osmerus eperlanus]|uniref:voltage-gated monoatomic cation channel TMEM109 isoform X2 n=1 Tax=Osmerus eperlanus TaxID=29151 RepID=UPI002E10E3CA